MKIEIAQFWANSPVSNFMEIHPVCLELFHAYIHMNAIIDFLDIIHHPVFYLKTMFLKLYSVSILR
jgi:hypothetical protein